MMNLFENRYIAHRGLHNSRLIPENSLLAFEKAVKKNYSIELDITISKDNQIVVFHDENLYRLCGFKENIEEMNYAFLKELKLYETNEKIPLFKEVLNLVDGKITLVIEIKKHKNIGLLENILIDLLKNYKGKYLICSFEKDILFWFKKNKPNLKKGLIFESNPKKFKKYNKTLFLYKYYKTKPDFISLDYKLLHSSIYDFCKKKALQISSWTIRDEENYEKIKTKVDAIIFENITL
ncbi:MAG: glycerophosphodiester phosphodiesterase family protein [Aliarcobacter sp.]|nr:glycerophosphodiester phosphodiesterase family protein [Aliarcobacter sp.]